MSVLRPRSRPSAAILAGAVLLAATGGEPQAGQGSYGPLKLKRKDRLLIEKSAELEDMFRRRGHVLGPGPETELVQRIGRAVMPDEASDRYVDFRFAVVRNPVPNAFALPDGQVYVHTGLLALLENEAQLASVLAHECMHVEGHHSIVHARQARKKVGGMIALSVLLGDIGNLINIALQAAIIGYGRDLEEEADRRAVRRVLEAGWDPRQMPRVFELLDEDPEGERPPIRPAWSDHPMNVARAAYTREILQGMSEELAARAATLRVGAQDFADVVRWSSHDSVALSIEADRPRTALSLALRFVERWPDDPVSRAWVGEAYRALDGRTARAGDEELTRRAKHRARDERRDHTRDERAERRLAAAGGRDALHENQSLAERAYLEALELDEDCPLALRGLGYLYRDAGLLVPAGRRFAAYLRAAPEADDRAVVARHLAEITAQLEGSP